MSADQLDRARLAKLLGLLGSDHDGEIAAAGRAADRLRRGWELPPPRRKTPSAPTPGAISKSTISTKIDSATASKIQARRAAEALFRRAGAV